MLLSGTAAQTLLAESGGGAIEAQATPGAAVHAQDTINFDTSYSVSESWSMTISSPYPGTPPTYTTSGSETGTLQVGADGSFNLINDSGASKVGSVSGSIQQYGSTCTVTSQPVLYAFAQEGTGLYVIAKFSFFVVAVPLPSDFGFSLFQQDDRYTASGTSTSYLQGSGTAIDGNGEEYDATSVSSINWTPSVLPNVTGINPTSGPTTGGTAVTITGSGFTGATAVDFGNVAASDFTVNLDTQITAISPAQSAGAEDVTVTTANGTSATSFADQFTYAVSSPPLTLTTPATSTSVNEGSSYAIDWTGGDSTDTVQLWAEGGPNNSWTELTTGVPETNGSYTWNTTGVDHGWYYFQAWDIPASGTPYAVQSPDYLHVVAPDAAAPNVSLTNPPLANDAVPQGNTYTLNFTATDGSGDTNPIFVQLWVYSGNTGQWTELPNANYLPATQGSYAWDTTGMAPGWYCFAAHATNGDQWSYASSPGWLNITVPTPTFAFTTPTSGQSVAAGGTFNLDWNITGLSSADASTATVQIWAQYLVNGSPVWSEIAASVSASGGTYAWTVPTSPGAGTYYAFSIWLNDGDMWWAQASPNWLQVT
jgi:hypothetical protein